MKYPISVQWHITSACQHNCKHCYMFEPATRKRELERQLTLEQKIQVIDQLEAKLTQIPSITTMLDNGMTPEDILQEVLGDFGLEIMDKVPTRFHCDCSKKRVEKAIVSLGENDLKELIHDNEPIEVSCHFCNTNYVFTPEEMQEILVRSGRA